MLAKRRFRKKKCVYRGRRSVTRRVWSTRGPAMLGSRRYGGAELPQYRSPSLQGNHLRPLARFTADDLSCLQNQSCGTGWPPRCAPGRWLHSRPGPRWSLPPAGSGHSFWRKGPGPRRHPS